MRMGSLYDCDKDKSSPTLFLRGINTALIAVVALKKSVSDPGYCKSYFIVLNTVCIKRTLIEPAVEVKIRSVPTFYRLLHGVRYSKAHRNHTDVKRHKYKWKRPENY